MSRKKGRGKDMAFAEFIAQNQDEIRRQSDSVATKRLNGVPVISASDEWNKETEWDEMYESLKNDH